MKKTRGSKYLGKTFNGWTVTYFGIATVQSARAKYPFHRGYYYLVERETSDKRFTKQVRLNAVYMAKFARGEFDIEKYADKYAHSRKAIRKTNYSFLK